MCFATIGPAKAVQRRGWAALWWRLVSQPLPLFGSGALLYATVWLLSRPAWEISAAPVLLIILNLLLSGLAAHFLVAWGRRTPLHYARLMGGFAAFSVAFATALPVFYQPWLSIAALLLAAVWLLPALHQYARWLPRPHQLAGRLWLGALRLSFALSLLSHLVI